MYQNISARISRKRQRDRRKRIFVVDDKRIVRENYVRQEIKKEVRKKLFYFIKKFQNKYYIRDNFCIITKMKFKADPNLQIDPKYTYEF